MTDNTIEPALTPDEWEREKFKSRVGRENRHALAAKLLHGQPFGFDYEDVGALRLLAGGDDTPCSPGCKSCKADAEYRERLTNLAARIEALLPPREPNEP